MANTPGRIFEVQCPCCGSSLQVDPETQVVLHHREPEKRPAIEDLNAAVQQLRGEADRRDDLFQKSLASHLTGEKVREKKFDELLKQAKEDTSGTAPKRPFDLD